MKTTKILILTGQILFLLLYNLYCYRNPINRTGVNFVSWAILYLILGISFYLASKLNPNFKGKPDKLSISIFIIAILTCLNIFAFDYYNVMVEYEEWFRRFRPDKPFWNGNKF